MKRQALLAVSFGTGYGDTREKTIGAIEKELEEEFPGYAVRRAFTSRIVRKRIKEREGLEIDDVGTAIEKLAEEGVKSLLVQPLYVTAGIEYEKILGAAENSRNLFETCSVGAPLLSSDEDFDRVVDVMAEEARAYRKDNTAIVLMGHGTEHSSDGTYRHSADRAYRELGKRFADRGYEDFLIGTMERNSSLDEIISQMKLLETEKAVLFPFLITAGGHAFRDMAGEQEKSWRQTLRRAGFEVECVLRGLGEYEGIRRIFAEHAREALEMLTK